MTVIKTITVMVFMWKPCWKWEKDRTPAIVYVPWKPAPNHPSLYPHPPNRNCPFELRNAHAFTRGFPHTLKYLKMCIACVMLHVFSRWSIFARLTITCANFHQYWNTSKHSTVLKQQQSITLTNTEHNMRETSLSMALCWEFRSVSLKLQAVFHSSQILCA